jgi:hypothetical protein
MDLVSSGANSVLYDFPKEKGTSWATPGFYTLRFAVEPQSQDERYKSPDRVSIRIRVGCEVRPDKFEIFASDSAKGTGLPDGDIHRASYPGQVSGTITGGIGKFIHMKLTLSGVTSVNSSQIFAQVTSAKGKQGVFIFSNQDNSNTYTTKMDLGSAEVADELDGNGKYAVDILIGDSLLVKSINWRVANLELSLPTLTDNIHHVDPFAPKPLIQHTFRVEETRPTRVIALLFTAIVLVPLAILIINVLSTTSMSPPSSADFLPFIFFHGSLLAILLLYIWYWLRLNIFQALVFMIPLSLAAVVSGRYLLRALHTKSTAKSKSE